MLKVKFISIINPIPVFQILKALVWAFRSILSASIVVDSACVATELLSASEGFIWPLTVKTNTHQL